MDENKKSELDVDDGFFDDVPNGQNQNANGCWGENPRGYVPVHTPPKKNRGKLIGKIFATIGIAVAVFFSGMLTTWACLDDEIRTLIKIKKTIDREYYEDVSDDEFYRVLFAAINDDLLDPYSQYMTAEEYSASLQDLAGNRSGIGVIFSLLGESGNAQTAVYRVAENSPADKAGLQNGDLIVGFGESETEIANNADFYKDFKPFLDDMKTSAPFFLKIIRGGEESLVQMSKEFYVESYVSYRTNKTSYGFTGDDALTYTEKGNALTCLADDTAYIKLSQFTGNAMAGVDRVMEQFKTDGMKNLVLDLRENGGGYLDYVQYISKYFCKNATVAKPLIVVADYGEKQEGYRASGNVYHEYFAEDSRIVVLADNGTASASECLIGCMVDYGAIGYEDICLSERNGVAKTYGKGIMQTTFYLDAQKKDFLKLTTAQLRWPVSGTSINARGILPEDGALTVTESFVRERELENAIKLLFPVM